MLHAGHHPSCKAALNEVAHSFWRKRVPVCGRSPPRCSWEECRCAGRYCASSRDVMVRCRKARRAALRSTGTTVLTSSRKTPPHRSPLSALTDFSRGTDCASRSARGCGIVQRGHWIALAGASPARARREHERTSKRGVDQTRCQLSSKPSSFHVLHFPAS
jgi:hypothetical protein